MYYHILILYSSFSYHIIDLNSNTTIEGYDNADVADTLNINGENLLLYKKYYKQKRNIK